MHGEQKVSEKPTSKKFYYSPELKEWGSIAEITRGGSGKLQDLDLIWDSDSTPEPG